MSYTELFKTISTPWASINDIMKIAGCGKDSARKIRDSIIHIIKEEKKDIPYSKKKVKQIKIHDFRHSHASQLLSSGVPITAISQRLGHSDIEMTLNAYSHILQTDDNKEKIYYKI